MIELFGVKINSDAESLSKIDMEKSKWKKFSRQNKNIKNKYVLHTNRQDLFFKKFI